MFCASWTFALIPAGSLDVGHSLAHSQRFNKGELKATGLSQSLLRHSFYLLLPLGSLAHPPCSPRAGRLGTTSTTPGKVTKLLEAPLLYLQKKKLDETSGFNQGFYTEHLQSLFKRLRPASVVRFFCSGQGDIDLLSPTPKTLGESTEGFPLNCSLRASGNRPNSELGKGPPGVLLPSPLRSRGVSFGPEGTHALWRSTSTKQTPWRCHSNNLGLYERLKTTRNNKNEIESFP